jgi:hypothetical protein
MITQQEIVDRLNQLTMKYNLTWNDIKYDADKAIMKINSYLGAKYPKMSQVLLTPTSVYALGYTDDMDGDGDNDGDYTLYEIFPDDYIHSIVIPFIAMEVLARDEEFTTIYNKYGVELEDGLFTMFQNEFNNIPLVFRQNPNQGVFFASESAQGRVQRNKEADLPVFKFRVYYHINNSEIVLSSDTLINFVSDSTAYLYGDTAVIKDWNTQLLSCDGTKVFRFTGWSKNKNEVTTDNFRPGSSVVMFSDLHLYANWTEISTLSIDRLNGTVYIKEEYIHSLTTLIIPEYVNNIPVTTIPTYFLFGAERNAGHLPNNTDGSVLNSTNYAERLQKIVLPKTIRYINEKAFSCFCGTSIIIPEIPLTPVYDGITIDVDAFEYTPNLNSIIIPANVTTIKGPIFNALANKMLTIYCRILERNVPGYYSQNGIYRGWNSGWQGASNPAINYTVNVWWGYNG